MTTYHAEAYYETLSATEKAWIKTEVEKLCPALAEVLFRASKRYDRERRSQVAVMALWQIVTLNIAAEWCVRGAFMDEHATSEQRRRILRILHSSLFDQLRHALETWTPPDVTTLMQAH